VDAGLGEEMGPSRVWMGLMPRKAEKRLPIAGMCEMAVA